MDNQTFSISVSVAVLFLTEFAKDLIWAVCNFDLWHLEHYKRGFADGERSAYAEGYMRGKTDGLCNAFRTHSDLTWPEVKEILKLTHPDKHTGKSKALAEHITKKLISKYSRK
jgi:hypothetical protein